MIRHFARICSVSRGDCQPGLLLLYDVPEVRQALWQELRYRARANKLAVCACKYENPRLRFQEAGGIVLELLLEPAGSSRVRAWDQMNTVTLSAIPLGVFADDCLPVEDCQSPLLPQKSTFPRSRLTLHLFMDTILRIEGASGGQRERATATG